MNHNYSNNNKLLIVYCSIIPHDSPPYDHLETAQELSKKAKIIFIDLPSGSKNLELKRIFKLISQCIKLMFSNKNTVIFWEFFSFSVLKNIWFSSKIIQFLNFSALFIYLIFFNIFYKASVILLTTSSEPDPLYKYIPYKIKIFDCKDQLYKNQFQKNRNIISKFDAVLLNAHLHYDEIKTINNKVFITSPGYYSNLTLKKKGKDKIPNSVVFVGGISHRIDYNLLYSVIKSLKSVKFFFIGEVYLLKYYIDEKKDNECLKKWKNILGFPNVYYLGNLPKNIIYGTIPSFKAGIIPYDLRDYFNYQSHPIKIYEYLGSFLPVVSTPLPCLFEYSKLFPIYLADTPKDFVNHLQNILNKNINFNITKLSKLIRDNSIPTKVEQFFQIIDRLQP